MRATLQSVAALVIGPASSLLFVASSARGWRQECGPNDLCYRTAHLFERQQFTVAEMSFLEHPVAYSGAEQLAQNRQAQVTMNASPPPALEVIPAQRYFAFPEAALDVPATEGDAKDAA